MNEQELQVFFEHQINESAKMTVQVISPQTKGLYNHKYFFVIIHNAYLKEFKKFVNKIWMKEDRTAEYFKGNLRSCVRMSYDIEGL